MPCSSSSRGNRYRDLDFLLHRVARDLDDLHAVAERRGDVEQIVGRADEQTLRQIERQIEVMVDERVVLARIEHLEHRGCGVSARSAARHLVNLVDHQHRILHRDSAQRLEDQPRHRADVRSPVAADLRLVAHAAHRDAIELAPDRLADRLAERRLAGARWADETENGSVRIAAAQLAHGEILDDPLLGFVQTVVPVVERALNFLEVDLFFPGFSIPWKREDPVEIRPDHLVFTRRRRQHSHAFRLAPRFLSDLLRQLGFLDLLEQIDRFLLAGVGFAQLGLNRAQLLAQIELALVLLDLDLRLALDVFHDAGARHLALQPREDEPQTLAHVQPLEYLVLVGDLEVHVRCREVGEPARVGHVHLENRRHFVRNAVHELGERFGGRHDARHEILDLRGVGGQLARRVDDGYRIRLDLRHLIDDDAPQPLQSDLYSVARQIDALVHAGGHAHASEKPVRVDRLVVVAARHHQRDNEAGLLVRPEQRQILRRAHLNRDGTQRVHDRGSQCHERQRRRELGLEDLFLALGFGHGTPVSIALGGDPSEGGKNPVSITPDSR
jgi:hypothetical protein